MPHLQYLKLQLQFKSKITEHLYTKRELVENSLVFIAETYHAMLLPWFWCGLIQLSTTHALLQIATRFAVATITWIWPAAVMCCVQ
jgi:hypothetical protein